MGFLFRDYKLTMKKNKTTVNIYFKKSLFFLKSFLDPHNHSLEIGVAPFSSTTGKSGDLVNQFEGKKENKNKMVPFSSSGLIQITR